MKVSGFDIKKDGKSVNPVGSVQVYEDTSPLARAWNAVTYYCEECMDRHLKDQKCPKSD